MVRQLCRCWRRQGPVPLGIELTETLHILMIPSCIKIGKRDAVFYTISLYELKKQSANILLRRNNVVPQIRTTYHSIYWINKSKSNRPYKLMMANKCGIIEVCGTNSGYDILSFVCSNDAVIVIKMTHGDNSRLLFFDDFGERDTRFKEITSSLAIDSMEITNTLLYAIVNSQLLIINFFTDIHDRQMIQSPHGFIPKSLQKRNGIVYVIGRLSGDSAIWIPSLGQNGIWKAPPCGVISFLGFRDRFPVFCISSPIHQTQIVTGNREGFLEAVSSTPNIHCRKIIIRSRDQTNIPITLFYRLDSILEQSPILLMAYGCYGIALEGAYDRLISYVIQSGITVAFCHIRGGGEYGEEWHRQAIKNNKFISINDFLDCTKGLIANNLCDAKRIGAAGSSAGALVVLSAALRRPDYFKIVQLSHPFLTPELILTDPDNPLTISDWDEFGYPSSSSCYDSFSPLAQLRRLPADFSNQAPDIWITAGKNDIKAPLLYTEQWLNSYSAIVPSAHNSVFLQLLDEGHHNSDDSLTGGCLSTIWLLDSLFDTD